MQATPKRSESRRFATLAGCGAYSAAVRTRAIGS